MVGECGLALKKAGVNVTHVTMLDTPHPYREHVTKYTKLPNAGHAERYMTSLFGRFAPRLDGTSCEPEWWLLYGALLGISETVVYSFEMIRGVRS